MARPGTSPHLWASDTNHSDPGEAWDGLAVKVTPSAPQIAAGFLPETEPPAEWFNEALNNMAQWHRYHEEQTAAHVRCIGAAEWIRENGAVILKRSVRGGSPGGPLVNFPGTQAAYLDLSKVIPRGATITRVRVAIDRNTATFSLQHQQTANWILNPGFPNGTNTALASVAAGTGGIIMDSGTISIAMNLQTDNHWLQLNVSGGSASDYLLDSLVEFSADSA